MTFIELLAAIEESIKVEVEAVTLVQFNLSIMLDELALGDAGVASKTAVVLVPESV